MVLIITEKPSVARDVAGALGRYEKKDGYFAVRYNGRDYCVTWAYGHLFEIDTEAIAPKRWEWNTLPVVPEKFKYRLVRGVGKQFKVIKHLLSQAEVVVNAGDPGREGELIQRLILQHAGYKGRVLRLWTSEALSPETVRRELNNLKPSNQFDSLYHEALARQHADWVVGINLTRAVSLQAGSGVWSIGRVQTPVLKMLVDRYLERQNFRPEEYYVVKARFKTEKQEFTGVLIPEKGQDEKEKRLDREKAVKVVSEIRGQTGVVVKVEKKKKKELPPPLHSLTTLQQEANKLYGFSAQRALDIAQKLYETYKCLSYPRTDARYLDETPQTRNLVKRILQALNHADLVPAVDKAGKRVFDSSKLTDHYALIPLKPLPETATEDEKKIYHLVARRLIGAFMPAYEYETTTVFVKVCDYLFKATGKHVLQLGWKALYQGKEKDALLPDLKRGEKVSVEDAKTEQKFTQPPKPYTEATTLKQMEKLGLGTPATRAGILETLKARGYVEKKGKALEPTPKGVELIKKLGDRPFTSPEMTGQWEKKLTAIREGKNTYSWFLAEIKQFTAEQIKQIKATKITASIQKVIGTCSCGGQILAFKKVFKCEKCGKYLFKEVFGKKLTERQVVALMHGQEVKLTGLKSRAGKKFDAFVRLARDGSKWKVTVAGFATGKEKKRK